MRPMCVDSSDHTRFESRAYDRTGGCGVTDIAFEELLMTLLDFKAFIRQATLLRKRPNASGRLLYIRFHFQAAASQAECTSPYHRHYSPVLRLFSLPHTCTQFPLQPPSHPNILLSFAEQSVMQTRSITNSVSSAHLSVRQSILTCPFASKLPGQTLA